MNDLSKIAIHTMTTKPWDFPTACAKYASAGVRGVGVWRQWLEGRKLSESRKILDDNGLVAVSLVRGGFFVGEQKAIRLEAVEQNKTCLDEAAALGASQVVLVCGAVPGIPLSEARRQIADGIAACTDHARNVGVKLSIEPLHPMYASDRSAINTIAQANDIIDQTGAHWVGIAADVYHIWWDPDLEKEIRRAGSRIIGFHVCDWLSPTKDLLNDRGLMGEGCIRIPEIRSWVEATGFNGFHEVEIFSDRWWSENQDDYLDKIKEAYLKYC